MSVADVVTNRNCVYQTAYHVIWCPMYRRDVLVGPVAEETRRMLGQICRERGWAMIAAEIQPDHIHLFVSVPPSLAVADAVKILKGTTARLVFQRFPVLKKHSWGGHLWSPSYYVGTAGKVSAETIRRYIERCERVTKRR
jgi:putative transposase